MSVEKKSLKEVPTVLIGTPGRICDHISRNTLDLSHVTQFVVDEYDKSLEFGFEDQIKYIYQELHALEFTTLVSATEHKEFPDYLAFRNPEIVNHLANSKDPAITFWNYPVRNSNKFDKLFDLLCSFNGELTIVFCNFREATESVRNHLYDNGYDSIIYHGGMEQDERERALIQFRNGSYHTLICTDLGSRGLDIPEIQHVVHFQFPHSEEAFIHRNGRTARMKANGSSYLLLKKDGKLEKGPSGQWQLQPGTLDTLKDRLAIKYGLNKNTILSYDEWEKKGKDSINNIWNVIIAPGEPDLTANSQGVLSTLLLKH
jgi:ATP-independent RNA helicase DbpA